MLSNMLIRLGFAVLIVVLVMLCLLVVRLMDMPHPSQMPVWEQPYGEVA